MSDEYSKFRIRLQNACQNYGLNVSRETEDAVILYMTDLLKWNRTYNLTALKTLEDVFAQHILDSLSVVREIKRYTKSDTFTLIDVGSGAGLPGVIIGLWYPGAKVICVDSVSKKMTFVQYISGKMGCDNIQALHGRIETLQSLEADIVISRAFASLADFVRLSEKHCKEDGHILAMKSVLVEQDIEEFEKTDLAWSVNEVRPLLVPEIDVTRNLVVIDRKVRR